ncbi:NmrA family NAD(P)-binding protein [Actinosynnema pretiosum]|uniref:NmrA family NAD(P)-binding protein n=1 Tax=Actinosynnema pretiosum TaxID=42197 RepID=UPI0012FD2BD6|nr:NAD(P)H-binding protein [Actinosynnema pretiosum]
MILVTGATGTIGGALAGRLAEAGVPFRALVRRADAVVPGAELVVGDLDAPETLPAAFEGVDQVFLNTAGPYPSEEPVIAQQFAAIDAAVAAGVGHVVKVSTVGARAGLPMPMGTHARIEAHLAESGLEATVLRPNSVMQNLVRGITTFTAAGELFEPFGGPVAYVDARDVADCAFAVLTGSAPRGGVHDVTGPRSLTPDQVVFVLSAVLGRPVGLVRPGLDGLEEVLVARGMPQAYAEHFVELARLVSDGALSGATGTVAALTGHPPRTIEAFINEHRDRVNAALDAAKG